MYCMRYAKLIIIVLTTCMSSYFILTKYFNTVSFLCIEHKYPKRKYHIPTEFNAYYIIIIIIIAYAIHV